MADVKLANQVYQTICDALDTRKWTYQKDEEKLLVYFDVSGDNLPIKFIIWVDPERNLIRLLSPLNCKMPENKLLDGAVAACAASYGMADGSFDLDLSNGKIAFRTNACYDQSDIGEGLIHYMISLSCAMVDKYSYQFLALSKGMLSISDFITKEQSSD